MTTATQTRESAQMYIHPHLGVAEAVPGTVEREVAGRTVEMKVLSVANTPAWPALLGLAPAAQGQSSEMSAYVPVEALQEKKTSWVCRPMDIDISQVVSRILDRPVNLWIRRIDVPGPANMIGRIEAEMSKVIDCDRPEVILSEIVIQISDYLALWNLASLASGVRTVGDRREATKALSEALAGSGPFWSEIHANTYTTKSSGRKLISLLTKVTAILALGTSLEPEEMAHTLDAALSQRLRARISELQKLDGSRVVLDEDYATNAA